jgi:hypothetical protein
VDATQAVKEDTPVLLAKALSLLLALLMLLAAASISLAAGQAGDGRTVIDNERGGYFQRPYNGDWHGLGADFGLRQDSYNYDAMDPEAVKGIHGRLQHFEQLAEINYSWFPSDLLRAYEADEVAYGRPPIWVTATYQGKKRKVLFEWHVTGGWGETQAVNIRDDRFIKFFIKQYCRGVLMNPRRPGWYVGLDNASFIYDLYGVLDDNGKFAGGGLTWDQPFPQSDQEWLDSAKYIFRRVREWAPDVRLVCNEGSQSDERQYEELFRDVPGVILEGFLDRAPWYRGQFYRQLFHRLTGPDVGKIQNFQLNCHGGDMGDQDMDQRLRSGYCAYLIMRGPNAFFGPIGPDGEVDPATYAAMKNALGKPTGSAQSAPEAGKTEEFRVYWREVEGGMAYVNMTGAEKTIQLPSGVWYDRAGTRVTSITLRDYEGDYVTRERGARVAWPTINPRRGEVVSGPITVVLTTEPWSYGATIHYTTDGSEPTESSPIYTGPFEISRTCVVRAKAFKPGLLPSFTASAAYAITDRVPTVYFHLAADEGSAFLDDYPLVALSNPSSASVRVSYAVTGGTAIRADAGVQLRGELYFPPGERYRFIHLPISVARPVEEKQTIVVTLSSPIGAALGEQTTYTYTILAD